MTTTTGSRQTGRFAGLAADDVGSSDDRPPLVLLHGMTFDRTMWRDIVPEMQRIDPGRRVLAIDLPGHGESPEQSSYDLELIVEQIYALPGLGRLTLDAILRRDYPVIQGIVLMFSAAYVLINLAVDLSYMLFDPRIRY